MSPDEIRQAVQEALTEIADVNPADLTEESSLLEDLDVDSLSLAEVMVSLEDRLGVKIPEGDLPELTTFGGIVGFLVNLVAKDRPVSVVAE